MIDFNRIFKTDAENGDTDERDFDFVEDFKARAAELKEDLSEELAGLTILDWLCFICFCALIFTLGYTYGFEAGLQNYDEIVAAHKAAM